MAETTSTSQAPTAQQPLFYRKVVAFNAERHGDWYLAPEDGYHFAKGTNCVYVAGVEFPVVAREYPIVFTQLPSGELLPVVVLGLKQDQNLFLDAKGRWDATYVPAYVRRYPFILAADADGANFTVCIDEAFSGFNTVKEGQRLMNEDGSQGDLLKKSVEFLKDYQTHVTRTAAFCAHLKDLDILEPVHANVSMNSGEKFSLAGFFCINRSKFKALPAETMHEMVQRDYMDLVFAHMQSLANFNSLINRSITETDDAA